MPSIHALAAIALSTTTLTGPPPTKVEPVLDKVHGESQVDNYRWLESLEADSEEVSVWTTTQNDYTRSILDGVAGRGKLEARLGELMSIGAITAPKMKLDKYFYTKREGDQNQSVLFMREDASGEPRELLDPNTLDERGLYSLDWFYPSHDGRTLAFGLSYAGDEMTVLHLMDVNSGTWLSDEIPGKIDFGGWAPDNRGFVYGQLEDPSDAYSRVFRYHQVGRHHRQDPVLIRQEAPSKIPSAQISKDGRWIITETFEGWSKQDVRFADVAEWRRTGEFREQDVAVGLGARFSPEAVHGDTLYLFTTLDAPNGMLYGVDLNNPQRDNWKVIIPEREDAVLRGVNLAKGMLVASYQKDVTSRFTRFTLDGTPIGDVELPGLGSASITTSDDRLEAFLSYNSFNEPLSIYRLDLASGRRTLWERPDVPIDTSKIVVKQEWATSKDGTKVPMFIVHRKGLKKDGRNPTLMYGYGGFNISITPRFRATNFPWMENGGIYVSVNLRGGGEYGESWHEAGMLENKQNVFDDLYAAAEYLIEEGYTSPQNLAVFGGSNGGLLTGVAATQRPDLWAAVISAVPLLDMLRYQNLLMAKFWVPEYGDPENPEDHEWLKKYSPYHQVKQGTRYPAILFTAGENDNRVHPMHARKMTAAMQAMATNNFEEDPIMLWVDREGGHGQGKPLHLRIRDSADRWSFLMWQTGMEMK